MDVVSRLELAGVLPSLCCCANNSQEEESNQVTTFSGVSPRPAKGQSVLDLEEGNIDTIAEYGSNPSLLLYCVVSSLSFGLCTASCTLRPLWGHSTIT